MKSKSRGWARAVPQLSREPQAAATPGHSNLQGRRLSHADAGRQLGRIGDALEVLFDHLTRDGLNQAERDALSILRGQLAAVCSVKPRVGSAK